MKISSILGLNARSSLFTGKYNSRKAKKIADSKIATDRVLRNAHVAHPKIYAKFKTPSDCLEFKWEELPESFALKPSRGMGGEGIIVVKKKLENKGFDEIVWLTTQKTKVTVEDLNFIH
ncbi:MAG: sugar-transfer associated ATP-grasp domain-containing protein [Candidatus Woesebacteria bacterium]|nr:sugar-transfer associated ATP-grasp domain-containing protein [Candidatus Woesebacteria bacterium]